MAPVTIETGKEGAELRAGDTVGRYQLQRLLGAGEMGQVFTALDPQLGRTVALKLIRPGDPARSSRAQSRLLREAQALARVQHGNVVTIHDVGLEGDRVFMAMELVAGRTLDVWLAEEPRSYPAIRDAFLAAGRGLAAAAAAGIVHRDFKPANVIIGAGRVVVVDFGLAGDGNDGLETPRLDSAEQTGERAPPPEPGEDQVAFAAALWEAVHASRACKLPDRARAALQRALSPRPGQRWPSLAALLAELARDPAARRLRFAVVLACALAALAGPLAYLLGRGPPPRSCAAPAPGIWDGDTRAEVRAAFLATGKPFADDSFRLVDRALRARLAAWRRTHEEVCTATEIRHEQSAALMDARMRCLARARDAIATFVGLLRTADARAVETATGGATRVGDLEACAAAALEPAATDPRADEIERELARAAALALVGRIQEARAAGPPLVERARALGRTPLLARALHEAGSSSCRGGKLPEGERMLYEAARAAAEAHDDLLGVHVLVDLVFCVGSKDMNLRAGHSLAQIAEVALLRAGTPLDMRARLYREELRLRRLEGDFINAFALAELALMLNQRLYGDESAETAASLGDLADVLQSLGAFRGALATYARALPVMERTRGPSHPGIAAYLGNMGAAAAEAGDLEAASAALERALAIQEQAYGHDQASLLGALRNLANIRERQWQLAEARALLERARAADEREHRPGHPAATFSVYLLAVVALDEGHLDEAEALAKEAREARLAALGPDHPDVADPQITLAEIARRRHDLPAARRLAEQALALHRKAFGARHPTVALEECDLARILLDAGDARAALPLLERSLAIQEAARFDDADEVVLARSRLAEALLAVGEGRRALETAQRAVASAGARPRRPGIEGTARMALARALAAAEPARAAELAREARVFMLAAHEPDEVSRIDRFLSRRVARAR